MPQPEETCSTCCCFNNGQCRRYPPTPISESAFVLPTVHPNFWCGEYRPVVQLGYQKQNTNLKKAKNFCSNFLQENVCKAEDECEVEFDILYNRYAVAASSSAETVFSRTEFGKMFFSEFKFVKIRYARSNGKQKLNYVGFFLMK